MATGLSGLAVAPPAATGAATGIGLSCTVGGRGWCNKFLGAGLT